MTWVMNGKRWRCWYKSYPLEESYPRELHSELPRARWAWWFLYQNVYSNFVICICGVSLNVRQFEKSSG